MQALAERRRKHSVPVFIGGVRWAWLRHCGSDIRAARGIAAWYVTRIFAAAAPVPHRRLARKARHSVSVAIKRGPRSAAAEAVFAGYGDAPFAAARRAIGKWRALDETAPAGAQRMFVEVKAHHDYAHARARREEELRAAADAVSRAPPAPALEAAPSRAAESQDELWNRALAGDGGAAAFGRPRIHQKLAACTTQCAAEALRAWAFDLRPGAGGGAPKRFVAATIDEFRAAYGRVSRDTRHAYEIIDAARPCWAFFDLEFSRALGANASLDGDALTARVVEEACAILFEAAGARPLEVEVVVLASEREAKYMWLP